jgi:hypothetical protein
MVDVELSGKVGVRFVRAFSVTHVDEKSGQSRTMDRVEYCAPGMAHLATTSEYVTLLKKDKTIWPAIEAHYEAWKANNAIPDHGTPLAAWPGVTSDEAAIFRQQGIRCVEDIAALQDSQMSRIPLPSVRAKRDMARRFLDSADTRKFEQSLAEKDAELADLRAKLDNLAEMMADKLDGEEAPRRGPGRPRKAEAAEAN